MPMIPTETLNMIEGEANARLDAVRSESVQLRARIAELEGACSHSEAMALDYATRLAALEAVALPEKVREMCDRPSSLTAPPTDEDVERVKLVLREHFHDVLPMRVFEAAARAAIEALRG